MGHRIIELNQTFQALCLCKYKQVIKTTNQNKPKKQGDPMRTQRRSDRTTSKKARENTNSEVAVDSTFAFLGLID